MKRKTGYRNYRGSASSSSLIALLKGIIHTATSFVVVGIANDLRKDNSKIRGFLKRIAEKRAKQKTIKPKYKVYDINEKETKWTKK